MSASSAASPTSKLHRRLAERRVPCVTHKADGLQRTIPYAAQSPSIAIRVINSHHAGALRAGQFREGLGQPFLVAAVGEHHVVVREELLGDGEANACRLVKRSGATFVCGRTRRRFPRSADSAGLAPETALLNPGKCPSGNSAIIQEQTAAGGLARRNWRAPNQCREGARAGGLRPGGRTRGGARDQCVLGHSRRSSWMDCLFKSKQFNNLTIC
jgi:hypothetical protein